MSIKVVNVYRPILHSWTESAIAAKVLGKRREKYKYEESEKWQRTSRYTVHTVDLEAQRVSEVDI